MSDDKISVDLEMLLQITRQKLVSAVILNTELEAIVQELNLRIKDLEENKKNN